MADKKDDADRSGQDDRSPGAGEKRGFGLGTVDVEISMPPVKPPKGSASEPSEGERRTGNGNREK